MITRNSIELHYEGEDKEVKDFLERRVDIIGNILYVSKLNQ